MSFSRSVLATSLFFLRSTPLLTAAFRSPRFVHLPAAAIFSRLRNLSASTSTMMDDLQPSTSSKEILRKQSGLLGSYNNEDGSCEAMLLDELTARNGNNKKGLKALLVTGGADNFMTVLAHPSVASVTVVDMKAQANAVAELKLAVACSDMTRREALTFMGSFHPEGEHSMDRIKVFNEKLKPYISKEAAAIIEAEIMFEIEHGYSQFGSIQNMNRFMADKLIASGLTMQSIWDGTCDMKKLETLCKEGLMSVDDVLELTGSKAKLPPHMLEHITNVLTENGPEWMSTGTHTVAADKIQNPIMAMTLLGHYTDQVYPAWLQDDTRAILREKRDKVTYRVGSFADMEFPGEENTFDLISPSNIFDWMPAEGACNVIVSQTKKYLAPNGLFMLRLAMGGVAKYTTTLEGQMIPCPAISSEALAETDQSPFWYKKVDGVAALETVQVSASS